MKSDDLCGFGWISQIPGPGDQATCGGLWRRVATNGNRVLPLSNHLFEESEPVFEESEPGSFNLAGGLD